MEELKSLWVGRVPFDESSDAVIETEAGNFPIRKFGEIFLRGSRDMDRFFLERVARIAFVGLAVDDDGSPTASKEDPFGEVTIIGPIPDDVAGSGPVEIVQDGETGTVNGLQLQVHYRQLTLNEIERGRLRPSEEDDSDIGLPPTVRMTGALNWRLLPDSGDERLHLQIELTFQDDTDFNRGQERPNLIKQVTFLRKNVDVAFMAAETAPLDDSPDSFQTADGRIFRICSRPLDSCANNAVFMFVRRLPIRFICLAQNVDLQEVAFLCHIQLEAACAVWRGQATLAASVEYDPDAGLPIVETPALQNDYSTFKDNGIDWGRLLLEPALAQAGVIEVYIAERVRRGNRLITGVTYDLAVASTGIILSLEALKNANYANLLAHELGHCLGLAHPHETLTVGGVALAQGSSASVMDPPSAGPIPAVNTFDNCAIFGDAYSGLLNPLAGTMIPLRVDCLRVP